MEFTNRYLTPELVPIFDALAKLSVKINDFNYLEANVQISEVGQFNTIAKILEEKYLTDKSICVLTAFLDGAIACCLRIGMGLQERIDGRLMYQYINNRLEEERIKNNQKPVSAQKNVELVYAAAREYLRINDRQPHPLNS
jgi:hypothetical protein